MVKKYLIMRHGQTFATKENRGYGTKIFSASLLPEAYPVLEKMAEYLKDIPTDLNVSSKIKRCVQTADTISQRSGKEFVTDRRLNEFFIETIWMFRGRVKSFLNNINNSDNQTVLIVTHGAVIACLISLITTGKFSGRDLFAYPKPGILTIIEDNQISQLDFNSEK